MGGCGDRGGGGDGRGRWLRRQAAQIVAQLPDDESEALEVLEWAKLLVEFLSRPK